MKRAQTGPLPDPDVDPWEQAHNDGDWHVYPDFGPPHRMRLDCWCHPERDDTMPMVVVHNVAN
jgi:hypothetical protein